MSNLQNLTVRFLIMGWTNGQEESQAWLHIFKKKIDDILIAILPGQYCNEIILKRNVL